jgi:hypothetical protein
MKILRDWSHSELLWSKFIFMEIFWDAFVGRSTLKALFTHSLEWILSQYIVALTSYPGG